MPNSQFDQRTAELISSLTGSGQLKPFYDITTPMRPVVNIAGKGEVLVLCANNYLGLADHPEVVEAGIQGLRDYGAGTASVRFICGTLDCHRRLEEKIASFVGTPSSLSYVSCWNANEALFPTLVGPDDAVLSDALNHASIIDGMRLMAKSVNKKIFPHSDLAQLESLLQETQNHATRWVITDGVFSMEGDVAHLPEIVALCRQYDAMLVVDDSHGVGVLGQRGRGTHEHFDLFGQIDVLTGTLGKALGGAAGGYTTSSRPIIDLLRQRSRPYLFSNSLPPPAVAAASAVFDMLLSGDSVVEKIKTNTIR